MKIMAIDYGEKRVGIASTDESGEFALPRMVLENDSQLLEKIVRFYKEGKIEKVILGESKNFQGEANPIMQAAEKFKSDLESLGISVIWHPEVLTTREARQIQGNTPMTDASAAALILKNYLDTMYNKGA
jgi:putative Holliday junction resolvase